MADGQPPIRAADVQGVKYFELLLPLLRRLHEVGVERDKAGSRKLHFDEYCVFVLLSLFNPVLRSVRALQQASTLKKVQQKLGCPRFSLGSFSEAVDVFDPQRLEAIIGELLAELPTPDSGVGENYVRQRLTAVDGSVVKTLASLAEAAYLKDKNGASQSGWRFHTQFEIDRHVPTRIDVTTALNGGKTDEKSVLRRNLEEDRCYVMDRWYGEFALFNEIVAKSSSYVCRIRDNSNLSQVVEQREVSTAAKQASVLQDIVVELGVHSKATARPDHPVRVILVQTTPHKKTGGRKGGTAGPPSDGILRIATNLLDVPAEIIAEIFRQRWMIEIFFRFFKHLLGCRRLLSQDIKGLQIQAYCAIIACLLINLWTGKRPTQRTYEMLVLYWMGWADDEELAAHLEKLKSREKT
ncbi:MAG: IS4 family transposase [Pirellulaceae bacterium]